MEARRGYSVTGQVQGVEARRGYIVTGQVQGVGFRPFVYRCATACGLTGNVGNTPAGVRIEIQGTEAALAEFERCFRAELPPLARVASLVQEALPVQSGEHGFSIVASTDAGHTGHHVLVSPDMAVCDHCLADMLDPTNRRYGYAFTNCTDCGPRYTITRSIPYDRPFTSMACFPLCGHCRQEYENPLDRRFHAQPNACPICGPELWLEKVDGDKTCSASTEAPRGVTAIRELLVALRQGSVAAIKGLGGFHLACDAFQAEAVTRLRLRKNRPQKALAVMVADVKSAHRMAFIGPEAEAALISPRRPVVICPRRPGILPAGLSPDTTTIGLMLPYAPLHHLLFHPEATGGTEAPFALVMTSGNAGGEPICLGNREAKTRLAGIADVFLFHNRDILVRVDDSVLFPGELADSCSCTGPSAPPVMVRRARGFVPEPLVLPDKAAGLSCVLAAGAQLKHTFCLTRGNEAFVSQHIGDLDHPAALDFFEETLHHLIDLLEVEPVAVVRDLHPDYPSSRLAETFAARHGLPVFSLQHHYAHIHAVLAEHGREAPTLGLALDGSGLGEDGVIWGGELLLVNPAASASGHTATEHRRLGYFTPFTLPGGEAAIRAPWRIAEALWRVADLPEQARPWRHAHGTTLPMLGEMLRRRLNCPATTSCGRLFDSVAAVCGLCFTTTYEGQAAILLEGAQDFSEAGFYSFPIREVSGTGSGDNTMLVADSLALFRAVGADRAAGVAVGKIARRFHRGLVQGLADWARAAADMTGVDVVAMAGGVMNNRTLATDLPVALRDRGLTPLLPRAYPPGDGAVSLGQAAWGRQLRL